MFAIILAFIVVYIFYVAFNKKKEPVKVEDKIQHEEYRQIQITRPSEGRVSRPKTFADYIGQTKAVERLKIAIESAKQRGELLPHCLLYGNAGIGKTSLAQIIAHESGLVCKVITGSSLRTQSDIFNILHEITELQIQGYGMCLFIDEIHDLEKPSAPETLWYPILESFTFYSDLVGKQVNLKSGKYIINNGTVCTYPFVIIGATTDPGKLTKPLRDRFGIHLILEDYSKEEIVEILKRYCIRNLIHFETEALQEISNRSRANPRVSINYLLEARDKMVVDRKFTLTKDIILSTMKMLELDDNGLSWQDIKVLKALASIHPKGIGLSNLAQMVSMESKTIGEMLEPYLKQLGYVQVTSKRFITEGGLDYLKAKEF